MAEKRAAKSGLGRDAQAKIDQKYDAELGHQCLAWIKAQTGFNFSSLDGASANLYESLRDGKALGQVVNKLVPGRISDKQMQAKMVFQQMELVNIFIETCKQYGVPEHECFATVDLTESQNMVQVVTCIQSLMRKFGIGPKEAEENRRHFTEEQLNAGKGVIGLQMGTNKGASQAGMNLGKMRHIVD